MQAAKRVLRYLIGNMELGVFYKKSDTKELLTYTDSNYALMYDAITAPPINCLRIRSSTAAANIYKHKVLLVTRFD